MSSIDPEHIHFRRIRPRIRFNSSRSPDDIINSIKKELSGSDCNCEGQVTKDFAIIYPPDTDQHYWSPQLTLTLESDENGTIVRGLYGPQPSVWTMFVFFYSLIGFITLIVLMVGLSYRTIGEPTLILWFIPVLILLFLSLYLVAYFGQKFGHKQMTRLHRFAEKCFQQKIELI